MASSSPDLPGYRIPRKPPPGLVTYTHHDARYPAPDPADPFAPLAVLRTRTSSALALAPNPSSVHLLFPDPSPALGARRHSISVAYTTPAPMHTTAPDDAWPGADSDASTASEMIFARTGAHGPPTTTAFPSFPSTPTLSSTSSSLYRAPSPLRHSTAGLLRNPSAHPYAAPSSLRHRSPSPTPTLTLRSTKTHEKQAKAKSKQKHKEKEKEKVKVKTHPRVGLPPLSLALTRPHRSPASAPPTCAPQLDPSTSAAKTSTPTTRLGAFARLLSRAGAGVSGRSKSGERAVSEVRAATAGGHDAGAERSRDMPEPKPASSNPARGQRARKLHKSTASTSMPAANTPASASASASAAHDNEHEHDGAGRQQRPLPFPLRLPITITIRSGQAQSPRLRAEDGQDKSDGGNKSAGAATRRTVPELEPQLDRKDLNASSSLSADADADPGADPKPDTDTDPAGRPMMATEAGQAATRLMPSSEATLIGARATRARSGLAPITTSGVAGSGSGFSTASPSSSGGGITPTGRPGSNFRGGGGGITPTATRASGAIISITDTDASLSSSNPRNGVRRDQYGGQRSNNDYGQSHSRRIHRPRAEADHLALAGAGSGNDMGGRRSGSGNADRTADEDGDGEHDERDEADTPTHTRARYPISEQEQERDPAPTPAPNAGDASSMPKRGLESQGAADVDRAASPGSVAASDMDTDTDTAAPLHLHPYPHQHQHMHSAPVPEPESVPPTAIVTATASLAWSSPVPVPVLVPVPSSNLNLNLPTQYTASASPEPSTPGAIKPTPSRAGPGHTPQPPALPSHRDTTTTTAPTNISTTMSMSMTVKQPGRAYTAPIPMPTYTTLSAAPATAPAAGGRRHTHTYTQTQSAPRASAVVGPRLRTTTSTSARARGRTSAAGGSGAGPAFVSGTGTGSAPGRPGEHGRQAAREESDSEKEQSQSQSDSDSEQSERQEHTKARPPQPAPPRPLPSRPTPPGPGADEVNDDEIAPDAFTAPRPAPTPPCTVSASATASEPRTSAASSSPDQPIAPTPPSSSYNNTTTSEWALPTSAELAAAAALQVTAEDGTKIAFGTLFAAHRAVVVFIRHFWCPLCQAYMATLRSRVRDEFLVEWEDACPPTSAHPSRRQGVELGESQAQAHDSEALAKKRLVGFVVIGNGAYKMIRKYRKIFALPFRVYTDPQRAVYHAFGMGSAAGGGGGLDEGHRHLAADVPRGLGREGEARHRSSTDEGEKGKLKETNTGAGAGGVCGVTETAHIQTHTAEEAPVNTSVQRRTGGYVKHGLVGGIAMVVVRALRVGMPVWEKGGDIGQLGGEFVFGPGLQCAYAHRMQTTSGHAPIEDVLAAAGVDLDAMQDARRTLLISAGRAPTTTTATRRRRLVPSMSPSQHAPTSPTSIHLAGPSLVTPNSALTQRPRSSTGTGTGTQTSTDMRPNSMSAEEEEAWMAARQRSFERLQERKAARRRTRTPIDRPGSSSASSGWQSDDAYRPMSVESSTESYGSILLDQEAGAIPLFEALRAYAPAAPLSAVGEVTEDGTGTERDLDPRRSSFYSSGINDEYERPEAADSESCYSTPSGADDDEQDFIYMDSTESESESLKNEDEHHSLTPLYH